MRRLAGLVLAAVLAAVLVAVLAAGCDAGTDPLPSTRVGPAGPAVAPPPSVPPSGRVVAAGPNPAAVAVEAGGGRLAVGTSTAALVLDANGRELARLLLDAPVRAVVALPGGGFRAVAGDRLLTLPDGPAWRLPAPGTALAVHEEGWTAVALPGRGEVVILDATGSVTRTIEAGGAPSAVAVSGTLVGVLDAGQSTLSVFDAATGARRQVLRAGDGATTVLAAERGRFIAVDTRDGELLLFTTEPLVLRQRYPAAGAPYGAAYDAARGTLWVTLTGRNEVVGYDVSGGAPREISRHATVRQPDAVAVDSISGVVLVTGRAEGLVQLITA